MRRFMVLAAMTLVPVLPTGAQNPKVDTPEGVLRAWEKAMQDLDGLAAVAERKTQDKSIEANDEYRGILALRTTGKNNAPSQACIDLRNVRNPNSFEKYICTGNELYEYVAASNVVRVHALPKNAQAAPGGPSLLGMLFGMSAKDAAQRYELYFDDKMPKDDFHYIYLRPKQAKDKADFTVARLAFDRGNHLLAQIWYHQPNGKVVTWNFTNQQRNPKLRADLFDPEVPKGWKLDRIKAP